MKNLINVILLIFIVNVAYSQNKYPIATIINNDTLICFTNYKLLLIILYFVCVCMFKLDTLKIELSAIVQLC